MKHEEIRAEAEKWWNTQGVPPMWTADGMQDVFIAGYIAGARKMNEECADMAFEKVRCDDRTDRWQVANEVSAHIRSLLPADEVKG